jgi:PHD/YefM family antitoxin component YafN of YafNO toxin-antitoxin module
MGLHSASLASKPEICSLLREVEAKTHHTMATFVGNHSFLAIINNYAPRADILYFTRKQSLQDTPRLSPELARPLHDLVMMMNTHPVR